MQESHKYGTDIFEELDTTVKPRIMLIPDSVEWILGTWAKEITKWNSNKYEFVIFPAAEIRESPELFLSVLAQVDTVHCLTPWVFSEISTVIAETKYRHLELISTIHHIVKLPQVADCLKADKVMVVCQKYLDELIAHGVPEEKVFLIYNGVDADAFSPRDTIEARRSFGIPDGALAVGFSAKATSDHDGRKGINVFCDTLSTLRDRIKERIHVILTGPGWENLQRKAAFDRIAFHYFPFLPTARMAEFYNAIDVYLVTARVEGGPVPLLEAMSCGTPVVTTPVGTALDFIRDGYNGLLVPFDAVEETASAIERVHCDADLASRLGSAGRETILRNLQWKDTVRKVDQLYRELKVSTNRTSLHVAESFSCTELTAVLIAKDTARWRRHVAPARKFAQLAWPERLKSFPKRFYSKVSRSLRSVA